MTDTITIGRRLIPLDHIALVEPFDVAANPNLHTERDFRGRVVLIDRESVLTEETPAIFAEVHRFRLLAEESVAANPGIRFGVETFTPAEGFNPTRPYRSRLLWRNPFDGNTHSKLLLSAPELVLAVIVKGEVDPGAHSNTSETAARTSASGRRKPRRRMAAPDPA